MAVSAAVSPVPAAGSSRSQWLLGPKADLLAIANLTWPAVVALIWLNRLHWHTDLELYLAGVIGTPHRWLTMGLVANDRERQASGGAKLLVVGALTASLQGVLWFRTHDVGLLLLVRYLWNVWHVAAQHGGIARIYAVRGRPELRTSGWAEKWLLRPFIIYAFLRAASVGGVFRDWSALLRWVSLFSLGDGRWDLLALFVGAAFFAREWADFDRRLVTRYGYLASVCGLYGAMIVSCHYRLVAWSLALSGATAVFHATEYFGFVTWSLGRREPSAKAFFLPKLVKNWTVTLLVFLYGMAFFSMTLAVKFTFFWIMANTFVSYLHYAWDAVLWKIPLVIPKPAEVRA